VDARLRESSRARATRRRPTTFAGAYRRIGAREPEEQGGGRKCVDAVRDAVPMLLAFITT